MIVTLGMSSDDFVDFALGEANMARLKAAWEVRAGLIPSQPNPEWTRRFVYTSDDSEEDGKHADDVAYQTIFNARQFAATSYHLQMSNPRLTNWAELTFIWY